MHTEKREDPLVEMGFETRDVDIPVLIKVGFWFFMFGIACYAVVMVWFVMVKPQIASTLDPTKPLPAIQLQSNISARTDIQSFRQKETQVLSTYAKNPDGTYRMPIDTAIDVIATRGLPHTQTSTPAVSPGNTIPQNAIAPGGVKP